jgi:phosphonate transport system substrate-binding protein
MRLFISYARVDKPSCEPIIHELEKAHEVFYDQRLHAGERWRAEIEGRVAWCEGFVYMLTPESVASEYCQWEYGLAREGDKFIFPVLLQARTPVPDELLEIQIADFSDGLTAQAFSDLSAGIHRAEVDHLRQMIPPPERPPAAPQVDGIHGLDALTAGLAALDAGRLDAALFKLRQARASGYDFGSFVDLEGVIGEAEARLEREAYERRAELSYTPIAHLVATAATRVQGCEAFAAFREEFPDYDPQDIARQCERHREQQAPAPVPTAAPRPPAPVSSGAGRARRGFPLWLVGMLGLVVVLGLAFAFWPRGGGAPFGQQEIGTPENPIVWSFYPSNEIGQMAAGAQEIADLLLDETGLYFEIIIETDPAAVVEAVCSNPPEAQMASLPLFAYLLAADRGCAEAALVTVRFDRLASQGQIIARADSGISRVADLAGKTFCRYGALSGPGWIVPGIAMRAAGLDPDNDLGEIVDLGGHNEVVAAVYNGDCDAGATFVDARENIIEEFPDVMDVVTVIEVTAEFPNDGIQFSPGMPQALRKRVVDGLLAIAETEEGVAALDAMYTYTTGLEAHGDVFYDPLRQMLQTAGLSAEDYLE